MFNAKKNCINIVITAFYYLCFYYYRFNLSRGLTETHITFCPTTTEILQTKVRYKCIRHEVVNSSVKITIYAFAVAVSIYFDFADPELLKILTIFSPINSTVSLSSVTHSILHNIPTQELTSQTCEITCKFVGHTYIIVQNTYSMNNHWPADSPPDVPSVTFYLGLMHINNVSWIHSVFC